MMRCILENESNFKDKLGICGKLVTEVKIGKHGRCDALAISREPDCNGDLGLKVDIVELKNQRLHVNHISQCARYKNFFDTCGQNIESVNVFLVVPSGLTLPHDISFTSESIDWLVIVEVSNDDLGFSAKCITPNYDYRIKKENVEAILKRCEV